MRDQNSYSEILEISKSGDFDDSLIHQVREALPVGLISWLLGHWVHNCDVAFFFSICGSFFFHEPIPTIWKNVGTRYDFPCAQELVSMHVQDCLLPASWCHMFMAGLK